MKPSEELKLKIPAKDVILEMTKIGPNEWSSHEWSAEIQASNKLIKIIWADRNKRSLLKEMLDWFNFGTAFLYVPELREKYIRDGIMTQEEIDTIIKPYVINDIVGELSSNLEAWDNGHRKYWLKAGIITQDDEARIKQMKIVRDLARKLAQEWIDRAWKNRKFMSFPENPITPLWALSVDGFIDYDEVKKMWDNKRNGEETPRQ